MNESQKGPIQYEVTAVVSLNLADAYEAFLSSHVADVLATGCFERAVIDRGEPGHYRVRYLAPSKSVLDRYLADHAPTLRDATRARFPAGIDFSRAVWSEWQHLTP